MMSAPRPVVIDASVAVALILYEPQAPVIERALRGWADSGRELVSPVHFWLEVISTLSHRPGWSGLTLTAAIHRLDTLGLRTMDIDRVLVLRTVDLVERHRLTPYDAVYLALAEHVDGDLASLDQELARAAGGRAIPFDDIHRTQEVRTVYQHDVTWPGYREVSAYLAQLRVDALAGTKEG